MALSCIPERASGSSPQSWQTTLHLPLLVQSGHRPAQACSRQGPLAASASCWLQPLEPWAQASPSSEGQGQLTGH